MANPIEFKPKPADPRLDLERRLATASHDHAEALLVAWDLLQAAHDHGLLDTAHGLVSARDTLLGKLAEYAKLPEGISGIRNAIALLEILMKLDPEVLDHLARAVVTASEEHRAEAQPPSLWQLAKRATTEDSRRGLSFFTLILSSIGKSLKK